MLLLANGRTCNLCSVFKHASFFHKRYGKLRSYCTQCGYARTKKETRKRAYQKMRAKNPDYFASRTRAWHKQNIEHKRLYGKTWREKNKERCKQYGHTRRVRRREGKRGVLSQEKINGRVAMFGAKCWMCAGAYEVLDHVKPLSRGGLHVAANIRPACQRCNSRKSNLWPFQRVA